MVRYGHENTTEMRRYVGASHDRIRAHRASCVGRLRLDVSLRDGHDDVSLRVILQPLSHRRAFRELQRMRRLPHAHSGELRARHLEIVFLRLLIHAAIQSGHGNVSDAKMLGLRRRVAVLLHRVSGAVLQEHGRVPGSPALERDPRALPKLLRLREGAP